MFGSKSQEIEALTEENAQLKQKLAAVEESHKGAAQDAVDALGLLRAAEEKIETLETELAEAKEAGSPEKIEEVASAKASEFVAGMNVDPEDAPSGSGEHAEDPQDGESLYETWREMNQEDPQAAAQFWQKHQAAIKAAA